MKLYISNGFIVDPSSNRQGIGTLVIEDGIISEILMQEGLSELNFQIDHQVDQWVDAEGKWVVPGLIDLHVHLREPGFEYKEDIASGCRSAARGGITTLCCMPNTKPAIDREEVVKFLYKRAKRANGVQILGVGAITKGQAGKELADYEGMLNCKTTDSTLFGKGICALSEDGKTVEDADLMREAMQEAKKYGLPIFSHAEPEAEIVERDLKLAAETGCRLHFCHISKKESVALIREAKKSNGNITAETAPHYFTMDESMTGRDPNKKMNPPLREKENVAAILEGIKDGTLDIIATDHAPHHSREKELPFEEAPFGVVGLETSFSVSYTALVKSGILTPLELMRRMSTKPAEIVGIERGSLQPGKAADLAMIDVNREYEIKPEDFLSKGRNSAFIGKKVFGRIACTIIGGRILWKEESND
ncbi:dihydroorotase [Sinanaerobacter chloroacetimidivorans]|jgi:dihydroorotase|uniref:Dihydroorotase n=1 Tax=Sinanaerobacter chloroacetimidivorans TaxID=2818044 RepID=A0A8J7W3N6_9FIRM|nr:dihydroorotase [Sinanaerobacter chloroacetimidivorans]MBR0598783.1 dihydroorotase [Sinanaerobacter chloroacetimidivorans]